jgi:formate/nitrite transporter FocA (FNT family)
MAQKYTKPAQAAKTATASNEPIAMLYDKTNYTLLAVSALIVAIGFYVMAGTTDIYSNAKIVVAPIIVLAGFGLGFYALLKKPQPKA